MSWVKGGPGGFPASVPAGLRVHDDGGARDGEDWAGFLDFRDFTLLRAGVLGPVVTLTSVGDSESALLFMEEASASMPMTSGSAGAEAWGAPEEESSVTVGLEVVVVGWGGLGHGAGEA